MTEGDADGRTTTVWVPGHAGWSPPRASTVGLGVVLVFLGAVAALFVVILMSSPAPAMKALGAVFIVGILVGLWAGVVQLRGGPLRRARAAVTSEGVRFLRPEGLTWPLRLAALCALAFIAVWVWAFFTVAADDLPRRFLALPLVGLIVLYGTGRSWFPGRKAQGLTLTPDGVEVRLPRTKIDLPWEIILRVTVSKNKVTILMADGSAHTWGARDLASDPTVLADLISFYVRTPGARGEIGAATLQRMRDGDFFTAGESAAVTSRG